MASGSQTGNRALVPEAQSWLNRFRDETAREIGVHIPDDNYWGELPARQCGAVGGQMVRKMIEDYEARNAAGARGR